MADLLTDVCHDVNVEPRLQLLSGETFTTHSTATEDNSRPDIAASGFWGGRFQRAFFDIRLLNPFAPSNWTPQMTTCYRRHECEKRRKYDQRIREVEHASFVPLVMSCTGGAGPCATMFLQEACITVDQKAPLQLQHSHGALANPPQLCPPAIVHHVSPQQQVICTSPKTN